MFVRRLSRARRSVVRIVQVSLLGAGLVALLVLRQAGVIGGAPSEDLAPGDGAKWAPVELSPKALEREFPGQRAGFSPFDSFHHSRQLLAVVPNCTPPAIEQFPKGPFTMEQRRDGAIILHIMLSLYMFLGLAIACDDYFVPSLERISDALNLQSDVAGATFMAAGSSAPELATAVIGVFIAKDDIGLGAVVGSAVFNIMFVISVCALFAGMVVYLHWFPLARDCLFYLISIVALVLVILDEWVQWYEAVVLLCLYALYILIMYFNVSLEKFFTERFTCCTLPQSKDEMNQLVRNEKTQLTTGDADNNEDGAKANGVVPDASHQPILHYHHAEDVIHYHATDAETDLEEKTYDVKEIKNEEPDSPFSPPLGCFKRLLWLLALPLAVGMYLTTPDCRRERWTRWYIATFLMSLVWISLYSYVMVWMITVIGFTLNIPDTVMGLTFVAAGVSVPDAIASLIVVQDGFGDMAVSNAVGSNVFDILLCLGLPWALKTAMNGGAPVEVYSSGLTYATLVLLSTVVFVLFATHINGWKLDKKYGVILMIMYFVVLAVCCLFELNVFGDLHPSTCLSEW